MFYTHQLQTREELPQIVSEYLITVSKIKFIQEELKVLSRHLDKCKFRSQISALITLKERMIEKKQQLLKQFKFVFFVPKGQGDPFIE